MKILAFTIRNISTGELIFAEGVPHDECCLNFDLDSTWLTQNDLTTKNKSWQNYRGQYGFNEEIRHLFNYEYDLVTFGLEEVIIK